MTYQLPSLPGSVSWLDALRKYNRAADADLVVLLAGSAPGQWPEDLRQGVAALTEAGMRPHGMEDVIELIALWIFLNPAAVGSWRSNYSA